MKRVTDLIVFVAKRLFVLLEIALKACLFLPILLFMVWFSYKVDISGLFQGELAPREVANMLLGGTNVSNYEQMDEWTVLQLYVQNLPKDEVPETVAFGSSRVLQLTEEMVGTSFYNAGMSGASAVDIMNAYYLFAKADKVPENIIICVDPWVFNATAATELDKDADADTYREFLQLGLGIESDYQPEETLEAWQALFDPAYFQGNVQYYLRQRETGQITTEEGNSIPFKPLPTTLGNYNFAAKRSDGSVYYPADFRNWNPDEVLAEALLQAGTLTALQGFDAMDQGMIFMFDQFVQYAQAQGSNVIFLLTPYHPFICLHVYNNPSEFTGFFEVEPWLRSYAQQKGIPLYGSYHPSRVGMQEKTMFFDGLHAKPLALELMFPGVSAALAGEQTVYQQLYLRDYGDVENAKDALIGAEPASVVVSDEWLEFALNATDPDAVFEPEERTKTTKKTATAS